MGMDNKEVVKVCPRVEELSYDARTNIVCPVDGCSRVLPQPSALRLHLIKVHKQCEDARDEAMLHGKKYEPKSRGNKIQYHCPVEGCVYQLQGVKHFTTKKLLREHFLRLHGEKKYICKTCKYGYGLAKDYTEHQKSCGITFECDTCAETFNTRQSLLNHCRRNGHHVIGHTSIEKRRKLSKCDKNEPPSHQESAVGEVLLASATSVSYSQIPSASSGNTKNLVNILPKAAAIVIPLEYYSSGAPGSQQVVLPKSIVYIADTGPNECLVESAGTLKPLAPKPTSLADRANNKSPLYVDTSFGKQDMMIQTEQEIGDQDVWSPSRKQASTGTQTAVGKRKRAVAQTQTTGDYILQKAMQSANIPIQKESRASQVSPRTKVKRSYNSTQTSQTQTLGGSPKTTRKKPRRCKSCQCSVVDTSSVADFGTGMSSDPSFCAIAVDTLSSVPSTVQESANNDTQTRTMWEELNDTLAESTHTQTLESFLASNPTTQSDLQAGTSNTQQITTETQTTLESLLFDSIGPQSAFSLDACVSSRQNTMNTQTFLNSSDNNMATSRKLNAMKNQSCTQTSSSTYPDFMGHAGNNSPSPAPVIFGSEAVDAELSHNGSNSVLCQTANSSGMRDFTAQICFPRPQDLESYGSSVQTQTSTLHPDLPDLLTAASQTTDFDTEYMNMQTQTMDLCDQLLSNMQTQTADSESFLSDFSFSNIETQTHVTMGIDDGLDCMSVETQTHLHVVASSTGDVESTDMETQTLFPTLDLGTPGLMSSHTQTTWEEFQSLMQSFDK